MIKVTVYERGSGSAPACVQGYLDLNAKQEKFFADTLRGASEANLIGTYTIESVGTRTLEDFLLGIPRSPIASCPKCAEAG